MDILGLIHKSGIKDLLPDKLYLKIKYWKHFGRRLNLKNPQTFQEKMQWLKLYNRKPEMTTMVDKYLVKDYVAAKIGSQCIIPTLGVWERFEEIDFSKLPNQFVLKCTHDSGGLVICKDKSKLNIEDARNKINKCLKNEFYYYGREWPYKNVKHRIIAEMLLIDENRPELSDYKFFCFNGTPRFCQVIKDRSTKETIDFFDMNWNHQEFVGLNSFKNSFKNIECPTCFYEMKRIATVLSRDIPFCRIDLYDVDGRCYFGEITFYPAGGFGWFEPDSWNLTMGSYIHLPKQS